MIDWFCFVLLILWGICVIYIFNAEFIKEKLHMWFTKKMENEVMEAINKVNENIRNEEPKTEEPKTEEWIWVEGYKATEKDMTCRNYQYILGELHNMPNDAKIEECESGFHLCKYLSDVFHYYDVGEGHRYFKVRALVRKSDYERYGETTEEYKNNTRSYWFYGSITYNKMVARSIVLESELTPDEILKNRIDISEWTDEYKRLALNTSIDFAINKMRIDELTELGYSETFAKLILDSKKYEIAKTVGSIPDLSMDMKCWMIFK